MNFPSLSHSGSQVLCKGTEHQWICGLFPFQAQTAEATVWQVRHCQGRPCILCTSLVQATQFVCRVRELEKSRFRKRMRPALYGNRSPLMRQGRAAVGLVSCCANPRVSIYIGIYEESYCLKGLFSFPKLFRVVIS